VRPGRNSTINLDAPPDTWDEQMIADVLETWDGAMWSRLARAIKQAPAGMLAQRTARCAQQCDVSGNGNVWLLLMRRLGVDPKLTEIPERDHAQHWP